MKLLITFALTLATGQSPTTSASGIKVGEKSRIHADVSTNVVYDSNIDRLDTNRNPNDLDGSDVRFVVVPGLELDVPGDKLRLFARTEASINHRFGLNSRPQSTLGGFRGTLGGFVGSKTAPVQLNFSDTVIRTPTLISEPGSIQADEQVFRAWTNEGRLGVALRPGGGALTFQVSYLNQLQLFDSDAQVFGQEVPDTQTHGGELDVRYAFLPKTAAFVTVDLSVFDLLGDESSLGVTPTASPLRVVGGLAGQVTPRLSAEVAAGYGNVLVSRGGVFDSVDTALNQETVLARARLRYDISNQARLSLGYLRLAEPSVLLASVVRNRGEFRADFAFGGRLTTFGLVSYENRDFGVEGAEADVIIGDLGVQLFFLQWLSAGARYRVLFQTASEPDPQPLLGDYTRHQLIGSFTARY